MFNWGLFLFVTMICLPGNWIMSVKAIPGLKDKLTGDTIPSDRSLVFMLFIQNAVLAAITAAVGTVIAPRIGLKDHLLFPFIEGKGWSWDAFYDQLSIGAIAGVTCACGWLLFYYGYMRNREAKVNIVVSERLRSRIGLWSRVLSGGIVEEVMFRWGLLSLFVWIGTLFTGEVNGSVFWISLILSGVIFGWAHIPGYVGEGCVKTPLLYIASVGGNLWVTLFCGWLFWHYGLLSAIVVHMLFHLLWYPFERDTAKKTFKDMEEIDEEIQRNKSKLQDNIKVATSFPSLGDVFRTEKQIYLYAFAPKRIQDYASDGTIPLTYHKNSGYLAVVIMMIHALVLEMVALHLLIRIWSEWAAWLLSLSSLYLIIYLLADYNAVRLSPLKVNGKALTVRTGFRNEIFIPFHNIKEIDMIKRDEAFQKLARKEKDGMRALNAVLLELNQDTPLLKLTFREPNPMNGYYGVERKVSHVYLTADEPQTLFALIKERMLENEENLPNEGVLRGKEGIND